LEQACAQVKRWSAVRPNERPFDLNVNVSARQLSASLVGTVERALRAAEFPAASLTLEITETMIMTDEAQVLVCLRQLKNLGVRIAVDDFGTGYSSLRHLERFPIDELKVDKSLVAGLDQDGGGSVAIAALRLARSLRLSVVAEGIETERQLTALRRASCDRGQGYLLGKPMCASAVDQMLATYAAPSVPAPPQNRILVVDDDDDLRTTLCRLLRRQGFETLAAATGGQALDIARGQRVDAVLLDVDLPDLNGTEVCQMLRRLPASPAVVHLSGSAARTADRVSGLNAGADAYLVKPVALEELTATLRAVLRSRLEEVAV
jgi:EAL domain-containing protein (putative c-di-GMP-specific phosphodiesterase class I)/CheY-like chemotaxis protein